MDRAVRLESYQSISERKVDWLWYPYLPYGKITLLQGDPGEGKSTFMLHVIAALTNGSVLPGEEHRLRPGTVIYQCAEDGIEDTIKPRLLGEPAVICVLKNNTYDWIAIAPCIDEEIMSFRVPNGLLIDHKVSFRIHSKKFVDTILKENGLDEQITHTFLGEYDSIKNVVAFHITKKNALQKEHLFGNNPDKKETGEISRYGTDK